MNLLIEPDELEARMDDEDVIVFDLCKEKQYNQAHIPGAHHLRYADIVRVEKPTMGLLPNIDEFSQLMAAYGVTENTHIVAYDDEGGGCAARLIWTLHCYGHDRTSLLDGGLFSWANEGHQLSNTVPDRPASSDYRLADTGRYTAFRADVLEKLGGDGTRIIDARSPAEFSGEKKLAEKAGHIPGAIHFEWTDAMDRNNNLRMLPRGLIEQRLDQLGISPEDEVICYCQSHHRSAYTYVMLRLLGYENVRGYPGSWSDWGNAADTPVEV